MGRKQLGDIKMYDNLLSISNIKMAKKDKGSKKGGKGGCK